MGVYQLYLWSTAQQEDLDWITYQVSFLSHKLQIGSVMFCYTHYKKKGLLISQLLLQNVQYANYTMNKLYDPFL